MNDLKDKYRILLVDDSATIRMILKDLLAVHRDMEVCGEACDGREAVEKVSALNPDIVVMDVQMPIMNGFEATERIMASTPKPVLILSSIINRSEVFTSLRAIELGALDVMEKPEFSDERQMDEFSAKLVDKIRVLARVKVITHLRGSHYRREDVLSGRTPTRTGTYDILGIGSSTGGPLALKFLLANLPLSFNLPIVVVQHITTGFLDGLASWLNAECRRKVVVAEPQQELQAGWVYFVPNGFQPRFKDRGVLVLDDNIPAEGGFKPSANTLLRAIGDVYGPRSIGLILTGMGSDGADGLFRMKDAGAVTIAQDRLSCIVYGMPRAAVEKGAATHVLPLNQMPDFLSQFSTSDEEL